MNTSIIPKSRWLGIEAKRKGVPVLIRLRLFDSPVTEYPELLVVAWKYPLDTTSQLPTPDFYNKLDQFERQVAETAEQRQLGLLVVVETGQGVARQFYYAKSADQLAKEFDAAIPSDEEVEFSSARDPKWEEYDRFVRTTTPS
jgi:hypothetical protein